MRIDGFSAMKDPLRKAQAIYDIFPSLSEYEKEVAVKDWIPQYLNQAEELMMNNNGK